MSPEGLSLVPERAQSRSIWQVMFCDFSRAYNLKQRVISVSIFL